MKLLLNTLLFCNVAISVALCQNNFNGCPPEGDATEALAKQLNPFKNREIPPSPSEMAKLTGWVVYVKHGGIESCNCHSHTNRDIHIGVVDSLPNYKLFKANPTQYGKLVTIVEITPRWIAKFPMWNYAHLSKTLPNHLVSFQGYWFDDLEHRSNAEETNPGGKRNWRKTIREIHPVTAISVIQ